MLRRIVAAIILIPLAIIIVAFAVANRHAVTLSFDPFAGGGSEPAASLTLPLFALVILLLMVGVLIGGLSTWLGQGKWRRTATNRAGAAAGIDGRGIARGPRARTSWRSSGRRDVAPRDNALTGINARSRQSS